MKRQFLGLLARVYVLQFAMEVPATVAMLAEMLMEYGFQVDIGTVRPLLRALQMDGYLESVLRDGIGRVYQLTEQGREELASKPVAYRRTVPPAPFAQRRGCGGVHRQRLSPPDKTNPAVRLSASRVFSWPERT